MRQVETPVMLMGLIESVHDESKTFNETGLEMGHR
jgi:hypothetical protein